MIFMIMAVSEIWKLGYQEAAKAFRISGAEAERRSDAQTLPVRGISRHIAAYRSMRLELY